VPKTAEKGSWKKFGLGLLGLAVLLQLVPYGRSHSNPPVVQEPRWNAPETRALAVRACFDCHSNETKWPFYSHIAPASWLVQHDVDEGREHLNFSAFNLPQRHAQDAADQVRRNAMPPAPYMMMHPEARLSEAEFQQLIDGLSKTFGEPVPSH
jgi:hypothetical protein